MASACQTCHGSRTDPPGSPEWSFDPWQTDNPPRFVGWSYLSGGTAPPPACPDCAGTGLANPSKEKE